MKKKGYVMFIFTIAVLMQFVGRSQDIAMLKRYLNIHSTAFTTQQKSADSIIINLMKGKQLFVMGERHNEEFNNEIRLKIFEILNLDNKLKKYFFELGRSVAYLNNEYLRDAYISNYPIYYSNLTKGTWWWYQKEFLDKVKNGAIRNPQFEYVGVDFERGPNFYVAMDNLLGNKKNSFSTQTQSFIRLVTDSFYLQYKDKFISYYKHVLQGQFNKDSAIIKSEMSKDDYATLKYLMSNANSSMNLKKRNLAIVANILEEITDADSESLYFLNIGLGHSIKSERESVTNILSDTNPLLNKVIVMNVYNDNSGADKSVFKFMKNEKIRNCFKEAAENKGKLILFDLSALSDEYKDIRQYGDLLLLIQNDVQPK